MRLIDADELLSDLIFPTEQFKKGFTETINDAPTIEAVPVVRCKDCVYYKEDVDDPYNSNCQRLWGGMIECKPESYCSDGITIEDYKRKIALRVNALTDEVEE